jgi:hypothetical protein
VRTAFLAAAYLAAAGLCAPPARALERMPDVAPLGLRTQGTLRELFLDVTGADARPATALLFDLRWTMANDWNMPTVLQRGTTSLLQEVDEQADSLSLAARIPWALYLGPGPTILGGRPLWERLSTTFELRATLHWGGWSDTAIERWHDVSGAFNFQRAVFPRNKVDLHLDGAFDVRSPRLAFGDLVIRNQLTLFEGGISAGALTPEGELRPAWAVALRFDLKAPTGLLSRLGGSGGWDAALALAGTAEVTHWLTLHGLAGASAFSGWSSDVALQPKPWHATAEVSAVVALADWAFFVEDRVTSPLLQPGWSRQEAMGNDGYLASSYAADFRVQNQLSFGLRRGGLSVWLSEDFTPGPNPRSNLKWLYNSNAPDVVLGVSYRREL